MADFWASQFIRCVGTESDLCAWDMARGRDFYIGFFFHFSGVLRVVVWYYPQLVVDGGKKDSVFEEVTCIFTM